MKSMMFITMPTASKAMTLDSEELDNLTVDLSAKSHFHIALIHMAIVIFAFAIVFLGKRMVRFCCRQANLLIIHPELRRHPKVEIYLELHCGEERVLLYLMTIRAPIQRLHFHGKLLPVSMTLDNHKLYSVLRLQWKESGCQLRVRNLVLDLPCLLLVPIYRKRRVQRIMQKEFDCTVIASDSVYLYRLETEHNHLLEQQQPYAKLIEDLKERQKAYNSVHAGDSEVIRIPEEESVPSAPNIRHM